MDTRFCGGGSQMGLIYAEYSSFVMRSLAQLGVDSNDLSDARQDVFLVVHRKLAEFEGRSRLETWLFGICLRVARTRRRSARRQREIATEPELLEAVDKRHGFQPDWPMPSRAVAAALRSLPEEQLAVLWMHGVQGVTGEAVAARLGIPLGTVYSRLRLARRGVELALRRAPVFVTTARGGRV